MNRTLVFAVAAIIGLCVASGAAWATIGFIQPESSPSISPTSPAQGGASKVEELYVDSGGGGVNNVNADNKRDGHFELVGRAAFQKIMASKVGPSNVARATSSCVDCQTLALALQIVVYKRGATQVTPANAAVAVNSLCTRCLTVARAIQYVIPVDDMANLPDDVRGLTHEIDKAMHELEQIKTLEGQNVAAIESRLNDILARFSSLGAYLLDQREETTDAASTPSPTSTSVMETATPSNSPTPGASSTAAISSSQVSSATPTSTVSTPPGSTATPTRTATPSP